MSESLSVFFEKPIIIDVVKLANETKKIFNFLLGVQNIECNLIFLNNNDERIGRLSPDSNQLYKFIETNILGYGGYILYMPDEYWEYHSDKKLYEFSLNEISFDKKSALFLVQLSMLISIAQQAECDYLYDTSGIFKATINDQIDISYFLNSHLDQDSTCFEKSLYTFYNKLNIKSINHR